MRVLVVEPAGNLRGSERALLALVAESKSLTVAVCCPPAVPLVAELLKRGHRVMPYYVFGLHEKSKWQRLRAAFGVIRACLQFKPQVIYLNQAGAFKVVLPAVILLRLSFVAHLRLFEEADYLARQRIGLSRVGALIAVSGAVKKHAAGFPKLAGIPLYRVYDPYAVRPCKEERESKERFANRIACVGAIDKGKGQDLLIAALATLNERKCDAECFMIGEGEQGFVAELRRAAGAAARPSVHWPGFVSDVLSFLRTASVLASPSHRETLGRVIFEAWDAGAVPVAYAGSGGSAEVVVAADGGILYDPQTPDALAGALQSALELSDEQRAKFVANGRRWLARNCDPKECATVMYNIFARVAKAHAEGR